MGRLNINALLGFRFHPAAENTAARKHETVHAIIINDGQFQIAIEWRGGYGLPLHAELSVPAERAL